ncbi:glutaminyl-peptide cyclotransferase [Pseudodesulfovibrio sediminis]|uniref:Glutamine cyclotransferase n=1 Tax=Pseudodesulfovibrio sediminis TaxID=2810563 RepID=A0ABN6EWY6_9BACT|nr:glutaminyl-peptide cyclotransferase [Pseudodesulfovibrio sediminis]BCS89699.1 glutamine cyclotransferase [Pseudodesulfovibrio sediminis]
MRLLASIFILTLLPLVWLNPVRAETRIVPCVVTAQYPHDTTISTQGMFIQDGLLYESSGGYWASFLTVSEPETGTRLRTIRIDPNVFAEGIAPYKDTLRLLTWKSGIGYTYTLDDFTLKYTFPYKKTFENVEGWGLTTDSRQFIMSSGTDILRLYDVKTFALRDTLSVTDNGKPVRMLNELEWVDGMIYANIWKSDRIAIIEPSTGTVICWLDLSPLRKRIDEDSGVANGIAYDALNKRLLVTGKRWNAVFAIEMPDWEQQ